MSSYLQEVAPPPPPPVAPPPPPPVHTPGDGIYDGSQTLGNDRWREFLLPPGVGGQDQPLDLGSLLQALDNHHRIKEDEESTASSSGWEMMVAQGFLIALLVALSLFWACCCKKRCFNAAPPSVQRALRKISSTSTDSKDLPPSYSRADLHTLAMSVQDYLYPPPNYLEIVRSADNLAYLDLESGHKTMSRLSFCSTQSAADLLALSAAASRKNSSASAAINDARKLSASNQSIARLEREVEKTTLSALPVSRPSIINSDLFFTKPVSRRSSESVESGLSMGASSQGGGQAGPSRFRTSSLSEQELSSSQSSDSSRKSSSGSVYSHSRRGSTATSFSVRSAGLVSRKSSNNLTAESRRSSRVSFSEDVECSNGTVRKLSSPLELSRRASSSISGSSSDTSRKSSLLSADSSRKSSLLLSRKLGLSQETLDQELRKKLEKIAAEELSDSSEEDKTKLETVVEIEKY